MTSITLVRRDREKTPLLLHDRDNLAAIFDGQGIDDMEVAVIGVIGPPKSGKSFLLNYIQRFFRDPYNGTTNWMKANDGQKPLQGFPWKSDSDDTSDLVCIWSEPFIVEKNDAEKIAVLLVEFGGADCVQQLYRAMALRMCSVLIFNEVSSIPDSRLQNIITSYEEVCGSKSFLTPRLAFLVRDTFGSGKYGEKVGKAYLREQCKKLGLVQDLETLLKNVTCALIPVPVFKAIQPASDFLGNFASLDRTFAKHFGEFIQETLDPQTISFSPAVTNKIKFMKIVCDAFYDVDILSIKDISHSQSAFKTDTRNVLPDKIEARDVPSTPAGSLSITGTSSVVQDFGAFAQNDEPKSAENENPNRLSTASIDSSSPPKALTKSKVPEDRVLPFQQNCSPIECKPPRTEIEKSFCNTAPENPSPKPQSPSMAAASEASLSLARQNSNTLRDTFFNSQLGEHAATSDGCTEIGQKSQCIEQAPENTPSRSKCLHAVQKEISDNNPLPGYDEATAVVERGLTSPSPQSSTIETDSMASTAACVKDSKPVEVELDTCIDQPQPPKECTSNRNNNFSAPTNNGKSAYFPQIPQPDANTSLTESSVPTRGLECKHKLSDIGIGYDQPNVITNEAANFTPSTAEQKHEQADLSNKTPGTPDGPVTVTQEPMSIVDQIYNQVGMPSVDVVTNKNENQTSTSLTPVEVSNNTDGAASDSATHAGDRDGDVEMVDLSEDKDIETFMGQSFLTCLNKFQTNLDNEVDLEKMKREYFSLAKKAIPAFRVLCSVKGKSFQEKVDQGAEDLEFKLDGEWESIVKQHDNDCSKVTQCASHYEQIYKELVKTALLSYFDSPAANFNSVLNQARSRAEAQVKDRQNFPNKFQSIFKKSITESMNTVNKKAMLVNDLASSFKQQMDRKFNMFFCLSDSSFKKCACAFQENAMKAFNYKDTDFRTLLEDIILKISNNFTQLNQNIRVCENEVAAHIVEYTKQCYNTEMTEFCKNTVRTTQALQDFHELLSSASIGYFKDACKFHDESGVVVSKYTSLLREGLDGMKTGFLTSNSLKVQKASLMVAKQNTKARDEYRKIMNGHLRGKSLSESVLLRYHDDAVNKVLTGFKLDIQQISQNCDTEINTLKENLYNTIFTEVKEENAEMKQREDDQAAKELAEKKRLQELEEFRRREIEDKRLAEEKKLRQEAAVRQDSDKRNSAGNNVGTPDRVKSAIPYSPAASSSGAKIDPEASAPAIAIELGLKFIRVGYMDKDGPQIIRLEDTAEEMPSVIGVDKDEIIFGTAAKECDQSIPLESIVAEMNVGLTRSLILEGKEVDFRLEELTALLLIHVKQKCEAFLGLTIPIQEAVIIIPAWYNHELRLGIKHAAELAGFTRNRLISEPSAVALGWWWENKYKLSGAKASSMKLVVGVASDFSFDTAGFEIDNNSVLMKTIVNKLNLSLGVRNTAKKKVYGLAYYFTDKFDPGELETDQIISKAFSLWSSSRQADHCVFMKTLGYEGPLNCTYFKKFCKGKGLPTATSKLSLIGGTVYSVDSEARSRVGGRLKEVQTYSLTWEDWTKGTGDISETGTVLSGLRKFEVNLNVGILQSTRINIKVFEKVGGQEREIAKVHVDSAIWKNECKKFKLNFYVNTEGILSAEAKFGVDGAQVSIDSNNLKTLEASWEKIQPLLASMGSGKAYQEAIENLKSIEQSLRAHVKDSKKILEILKTPIVKEIDKIMALVDDRSSLAEVEDAIKKLTKYSEKYMKD